MLAWNTGVVARTVAEGLGEHDERLRPFRSLKDVRQRAEGMFIVESERVFERAVALGLTIIAVLLTPVRFRRLAGFLEQIDGHVFVAEAEIVDAVVGFPLHRGVIALAQRPPLISPFALLGGAQRVIVLEDVVDPDNVGSVFRHAAAFGADAILLSAHAGDPLYRKAVRTSMGWVLDVPWTRLGSSDELVPTLRESGFTTLALTPSGDVDIRDPRLAIARPDRMAIVLGAESDGLRVDTLGQCDHRVRVPISPHVDSLNVATTAAIAAFELFR